jgi:hypothetical protein
VSLELSSVCNKISLHWVSANRTFILFFNSKYVHYKPTLKGCSFLTWLYTCSIVYFPIFITSQYLSLNRLGLGLSAAKRCKWLCHNVQRYPTFFCLVSQLGDFPIGAHIRLFLFPRFFWHFWNSRGQKIMSLNASPKDNSQSTLSSLLSTSMFLSHQAQATLTRSASTLTYYSILSDSFSTTSKLYFLAVLIISALNEVAVYFSGLIPSQFYLKLLNRQQGDPFTQLIVQSAIIIAANSMVRVSRAYITKRLIKWGCFI